MFDRRFNHSFDARVDNAGMKFVCGVQIGADHHSPDRLPDVLGEQYGIPSDTGGLAERFQDGDGIADRDPLTKEILQNTLHGSQREQFGNQILNNFGVLLGDPVQQPFGILAGIEFVGIFANGFSKMGAQNAHPVDHGVAGIAGLFGLARWNPHRRNPKCGFPS